MKIVISVTVKAIQQKTNNIFTILGLTKHTDTNSFEAIRNELGQGTY